MEEGAAQGFQAIHRLGLLGVSLLLMTLVLELVRRGRLKERYALLWLGAAGGSLLVGLFPAIIVRLADVLHFQYLTVVYTLSFLFLLAIVLAFSVVISLLSERCRVLAQESALLSQRLEELERRHE